MKEVPQLGTDVDMMQRDTMARTDSIDRQQKVASACSLINDRHYGVNSAVVERLLKPESLVPTTNAFLEALLPFDINFYQVFVVDLLHEFELGVWKMLFTHLIRVLYVYGEHIVNELDRRYREMPTFGTDTIRRFASNSSEMKKMAARDYEDLLQCAIPVFEGLLPEPHNTIVLDLLFMAAHWHALAKLRMHTDETAHMLDQVTAKLGAHLRKFQEHTCPVHDTRELRQEAAARQRREAALQGAGSEQRPARKRHTPEEDAVRTRKTFTLETYKVHTMGDYTRTILQYRTTDSYSTQTGELEHCLAKQRYSRTNKKQFEEQVTQIERRQLRIKRLRQALQKSSQLSNEQDDDGGGSDEDYESMATSDRQDDNHPSTFTEHHYIGHSQKKAEEIGQWAYKIRDDPAGKDFMLKLKAHLLPRILSTLQSESSMVERVDNANGQADYANLPVFFKADRIYHHQTLSINYTTYDVRRSWDCINPSTPHRDIMLIKGVDDLDESEVKEGKAFNYARVLGIFHANIVYMGPGMLNYRTQRMEFLWVRWFQHDLATPAGWSAHRLDRLPFVAMDDDRAFGFVDPNDVLRGCHISPAYAHNKLHTDGIAMSRQAKDGDDWKAYYVNRLVDRDMLMRHYWGSAVGHTYARHTVRLPATPQPLLPLVIGNGESPASLELGFPASDEELVVVDDAGDDLDGEESDESSGGEGNAQEESDRDDLNLEYSAF